MSQMCRLFGLRAGKPVTATFWLLDAPDSLAAQSRRNPDGAGIGIFTSSGTAEVSKQPIAAWSDAEFLSAARSFTGTTFVAHVRYASTGGLTEANTHPFLQDGRLLAHNGVLGGLAALDQRIADLGLSDLVLGQTDSERLFALITGETRRHAGDVEAGIRAAVGWIASNVPVYSVNFVLTTPTDLWALRYPASHPLMVLERPSEANARRLDARTKRISVASDDLADCDCIVVATEAMDDDPGWTPLASGELLHVAAALGVHRRVLFPEPPRQLLTLNDLEPTAAASQQPMITAA